MNYFSIAVMTASSVFVARDLGPSGRGEFAAIMAWFAVALALGEMGQSGALTHWVARAPDRAPTFVKSGRSITLTSSLIITACALIFAPILANGDGELTTAFRIAFCATVLNGLWGPYMYATQALSIPTWNAIRLAQPLTYGMLVALLLAVDRLTIITLALTLTISTSSQMAIARLLWVRISLAKGRSAGSAVRNLLGFGLPYAGSFLPLTVSGQYDKVALSQTVDQSALGHYAVSTTVASLSAPFSTAISSVVFPRLSAQARPGIRPRQIEVRAILLTAAATGVTLVVLCLAAIPLVPLLFGAAYRESIALTWYLAPAMLLRGLSQVIGMIIRSRQRPGLVTWAQIAGLATGAATILPCISAGGAAGAAISVTALEAVTLSVLLYTFNRTKMNGRSRNSNRRGTDDQTSAP